MDFQECESMQKKMVNSREVTVNLAGNPGGQFKKIDILNMGGGVKFFPGKAKFLLNILTGINLKSI